MKCFYRISQFGMSRVTRILEKKKHNLVVGEGAILKIADFLKKDGIETVFVATTPGFIKRGTLQPFFDSLTASGIKYVLFTDLTPDPTIESVEAARAKYAEGKCQAIVAIGGGSVIDCSKAMAARIVRPKMTIRQMRGMLKINRALPPFYAVPTTAGTGSEVTVASVVTDTVDGVHYKSAISDPCLVPKCAVMDAALTTALPPAITAATGMDALTHAVEAYTNRFASKFVRKKALDAVHMIYENLPVVYAEGNNVKARENMLLASYYAGLAFTNNFVGYVHAVAHALGALYGIPHGQANAIVMPYVMEQYGKSAEKELSELADVANIDGHTQAEKASNFIESMRKMNRDMQIPCKVEQLKESDFDTIISRALKEANPAYPVPAIWGKKDFEKLLKKLLP